MNHELSESANNTQGSHEPLSEPHFDDEATLLSARRVVPFHKLTDKTNSKRYLVFPATLAAALLMGVVGGVIYARFEETPAPTAKTIEPATQPAWQNEASSSVQSAESVSTAEESKAVAADNGNQKSLSEPRNPGTSKRVTIKPASARQVQTEPDKSEYYATERERRRAERREASRARRQGARETQRSDDLFRIQEIFEGSSRP